MIFYPEGIVEIDKTKVLWHFMIPCNDEIADKNSVIVFTDKEMKLCGIIDISFPAIQ